MKKILFHIVWFLTIQSTHTSYAQNLNVDSIKNIIKTDKPDTNNVRHLLDLSWELSYFNSDTAIIIASKALNLSKKLNWQTGAAAAHHDLGSFYGDKGDYLQSLKHSRIALELYEEIAKSVASSLKYNINNKITTTLNNLGLAHYNQGNYPKALDYYLKGLRIAVKYNNEEKIATIYGNLGIVYTLIYEYETALDYYIKALKIATKNKDEGGILNNKFNIAGLYYNMVNDKMPDSLKKINYDYALKNYLEVLKICDKPQFLQNKSTVLANIGLIYDDTNESEKAIEYYSSALKLDQEFGNKNNCARVTGNIGLSYFKLKKYDLSETYLKKSLLMCDSLGMLNEHMQCENYLYDLYQQTGAYKNSLEHFKAYSNLKDSIFNEEKSQELTRHEMNYEFEKKEAVLRAEQDKKEAVSFADKKRQNILLGLILIVAAAIGSIAIIIFRSLRITRKQKDLIQLQKELVEEKQREILDSIHYAKRIQRSLLPTEKYIQNQITRLKS